ncbi:hypothetical protein PoB_000017600 [Plakobranchus ocellatus]|uniref:Uncharacterized protein n=1 Tax=Plakobranchus ocellatus TaxID=259542 RepID=A0AAV3WRX9_9GAST|nr:hypothetical protein PoB_000017600 [Plakobranchus ocellatus]
MSEKKQEKGHNSKSFDQINLKLTQIEVHSSTTSQRHPRGDRCIFASATTGRPGLLRRIASLRRSRVLQYRDAKGLLDRIEVACSPLSCKDVPRAKVDDWTMDFLLTNVDHFQDIELKGAGVKSLCSLNLTDGE